MKTLIHKLLYRTLSLEEYLRAVSRMFFMWHRLGIGRYAPATEYVYHLPQLLKRDDTAIDIGANLGYYAHTMARIVGATGRIYAVEPVPPILAVLRRNLAQDPQVEILPYALGTEQKEIRMANNSARKMGYFGTGQNFVDDTLQQDATDATATTSDNTRSSRARAVEFTAQMRRGSELFAQLQHLDFIKCDIEGYEVVVMTEMRPLVEQFHPTVLIETGGENRTQIIHLFTQMGYTGYTLEHGTEVPLTAEGEKDIIFRYAH